MCRIHGRGCSISWGYDPAHTDSDQPYTLDELAVRQGCPHFYAYPTHEDYLEGWNLWRAIRRDDRLTAAEADVKFQTFLDHRGYRDLFERALAEPLQYGRPQTRAS